MWCQTKRTGASFARNQDILHGIALTSDAMSMMNMVILSWIVHTRYLLQELQWHTASHIGIIMPYSGLRHHHNDRERWSQSRSQSHYRRHHSSNHHDSHRDHSWSQHWGRHSHHKSSSWQLCSVHRGCSHRPYHDTPHMCDFITDHPSTKAPQVTDPVITADHLHDHPTDLQDMNLADQVHIPAGWEEYHISRRTWRWRLRIRTLIIIALMTSPVTQGRTLIL